MDQSLVVPKKDVAVLPVFLGARLYDREDLYQFSSHANYSGFSSLVFDPHQIDNQSLKPVLAEAQEEILRYLKTERNLAIFFIMTHYIADHPIPVWHFIKRFEKMPSVYACPVVWDSGGLEQMLFANRGSLSGYLLRTGRASHIFFNSDAPTAGGHRMAEFVSRIMGYDLPGDDFPNYPPEIRHQIAKYISRENFNFWGKRAGSIPKYPIVEGKPRFPTLDISVKCPDCGADLKVDRVQLKPDGSAEIRCFNREGGCNFDKKHLLEVAKLFDSWPDFDEHASEACHG